MATNRFMWFLQAAACRVNSPSILRKGPFTPRWGWDNQVYGWSADGKRIIFKSQRDSWALPIARLYSVSVEGGAAEALPMPEAGSGDFSGDSSKIVYSRNHVTSVRRSAMAVVRPTPFIFSI